ncbi:MAG: hypothetical protein EOO56_18065, partial [Hymenobacter sp.]
MELADLSVRRRLSAWWAWLLVLSGLLCFGGGYVASQYGQTAGNEARPGTAQVQRLVQQATATARREASAILATTVASRSVQFGRLLRQSTYPTFLLEQGHLRAWSAAGPLPTAADQADPRPEWLSQDSLGNFVVVRQAAAGFAVLVYVP